jgi:hypothetical protein
MPDKKPDNVSDNPNILPYGSNVGAPSIIVDNIDSWKQVRIDKVNKQFQSKFNELKSEYQKLIDEYNWNDLVYQSKFNFEPVIGEIYHLYCGNDDKVFLSLINPNEWNKQYVGSFKYNYDNKWIKTE